MSPFVGVLLSRYDVFVVEIVRLTLQAKDGMLVDVFSFFARSLQAKSSWGLILKRGLPSTQMSSSTGIHHAASY